MKKQLSSFLALAFIFSCLACAQEVTISLTNGTHVEDTLFVPISATQTEYSVDLNFHILGEEDQTRMIAVEKIASSSGLSFHSIKICAGDLCFTSNPSPKIEISSSQETLLSFTFSSISNGKTATFAVIDPEAMLPTELRSFVVKFTESSSNLPAIASTPKTSVKVYPNPVSEKATFHFTLPSVSHDACIIIRNMIGKVVKNIPLGDYTSGKVSTDINDLDDGVYFYSIVANGKRSLTKKLIIRH